MAAIEVSRPASWIVALALVIASAFAGPALAQEPDSLSETYSAWTVRCSASGDNGRRCVMSQSLQRDPGGERLLLVELAIDDGKTLLSMLTPFGLAVGQGASLQIDEDEPQKVPFFTCLPSGCLLRHTLTDDAIAAMRRGASLKSRFIVAQSGEAFELANSLNGFSAAYRRLRELAKE